MKQGALIFVFYTLFCVFTVSRGGVGPCGDDGAFGWSDWSACTVTCSGGTRSRSCTCVFSLDSTPTCTEGDNEIEICNENSCPSDDSNDGAIAGVLFLLLICLKWFPYYFG